MSGTSIPSRQPQVNTRPLTGPLAFLKRKHIILRKFIRIVAYGFINPLGFYPVEIGDIRVNVAATAALHECG